MKDLWTEVFALIATLDGASYYELLALPRAASGDEVRAAYTQKVTRYHPDRHAREPDPARRRALVTLQARCNEAYRVLSDPRRRAQYDRALASGQLRQVGRAEPVRDEPASPQARRYFHFGKECERASDRAGALMNDRFAQQLEPDCDAVRAALDRLEARAPAPVAPVAPPPPPPAIAEQRTAPRVPYGSPVRLKCHTWERFLTLCAHDLCASGMFLKTRTVLDVGTPIELEIVVPDGRVLALLAEVAHVIPADRASAGATPGIGLRFAALDGERRALLDQLVRDASAAAR